MPVEHIERAKEVEKASIPGEDNDYTLEMLERAQTITKNFIEDTNDWFEIEKVHVYPENKIGITAKFRWTIERFIAAEVEDVIMDAGYGVAPHLEADWRDVQENEIEYRARKQEGGTRVFLNLLIEMTDRAFEALNNQEEIEIERTRAEVISDFMEEFNA